MPKTTEIQNEKGALTGEYLIDCVACKCSHCLATKIANENGSKWAFNGDVNSPTFHPSLKVTVRPHTLEKLICHSFIKNGKMEYLSDSTHDLAGHTVELPEQ